MGQGGRLQAGSNASGASLPVLGTKRKRAWPRCRRRRELGVPRPRRLHRRAAGASRLGVGVVAPLATPHVRRPLSLAPGAAADASPSMRTGVGVGHGQGLGELLRVRPGAMQAGMGCGLGARRPVRRAAPLPDLVSIRLHQMVTVLVVSWVLLYVQVIFSFDLSEVSVRKEIQSSGKNLTRIVRHKRTNDSSNIRLAN
ncbi:hypothetical protein EJB05_39635 [Eragrostis curvula]|uniref:Uncharacterized protein n=1 Tax=Eragrostis curvula TaxID=38414 RepID=A0A5J9TY39_9POAL|nr:hypothetical protein EJB05_39635 [Eragrostis curvula]